MDVSGSGTLTFTTYDNTTISGDLTTSGGSQGTFTLNGATRWAGNVNTEPGGTAAVTLNDSSNLTGDLFTGAGTTATFTLNGNSWLKGSSAIEWGNADISLNGSGTAWYIPQSSRISAVTGVWIVTQKALENDYFYNKPNEHMPLLTKKGAEFIIGLYLDDLLPLKLS